jgi:hypothetical protein
MIKTNWHKSAAKDVRPFFGAAALEHSLDGAEIQLFNEAPFSADASYIIESLHLQKLALAVRPNFDARAIDEAAIDEKDLILAITAVQPFLKKTCLIRTLHLAEEIPEEISISDEILAQLGGGATLNVEVALCLGKGLPRRPGAPFLLGHWLAKKVFTLRPPKIAEEFDVEPMDDEGWKHLGFPPKTLYNVEFFGGMNEPASKDRQMAKVRIHIDVYNKLSLETNQRLAKPLMATLAAEISCQLLAQSMSEWESADEVVTNSPLSAFLKRLTQVQPCDLTRLKELVKAPGMPMLRAMLHADQQTVRTINEG